jgi:hypothetical protein
MSGRSELSAPSGTEFFPKNKKVAKNAENAKNAKGLKFLGFWGKSGGGRSAIFRSRSQRRSGGPGGRTRDGLMRRQPIIYGNRQADHTDSGGHVNSFCAQVSCDFEDTEHLRSIDRASDLAGATWAGRIVAGAICAAITNRARCQRQ